MSFNFGPDKYKKDREEMEAERRQQRIVARRKGLPDPTEPSSSDDDDDDDEEEGDEEHKGMNQYSKLMERANECLYRMELEPSRTFLKEAWELAESAEMKAEVMDTVAQTYLEDSDESAKEEAVKAFTDAESYAPNTSFERYLAMGQLANGHDSLKYYQSGVDLLISMLKELPPKKKNEDPELTAERLSLSTLFFFPILLAAAFAVDLERYCFLIPDVSCSPKLPSHVYLHSPYRLRVCLQRSPFRMLTAPCLTSTSRTFATRMWPRKSANDCCRRPATRCPTTPNRTAY